MSLPRHCPECGDHLRACAADDALGLAQFLCKRCRATVVYFPQDEQEWTTASSRAAQNQRTETVP